MEAVIQFTVNEVKQPINDLDLIFSVREHSLIYNINIPEYKNLAQRQSAWQEISETLGFEGTS